MYAKPQQKRYSVERLRSLYTRLLRCIDINTDDLCPRGMEDDIDVQNSHWGWDTMLSSYMTLFQPQQIRAVGQNMRHDNEKVRSDKRKEELDRAFRAIAALNHTTVSSKMHDGNDASVIQEEEEEVSEHALRTAHKMEMIAVQIIHDIGDIVIHAERPSSEIDTELRSDDVFAYFCEKAILSMMVEIMMDQPVPSTTTKHNLTDDPAPQPVTTNSFNGVAWSPKVKAQILLTVTLLLSRVRDRSAVYYLLSQHCMNQLIVHLLPLSQWTESALQIMVYPYIDLLKILSMHLSGSPDLFPLYTIEVPTRPPTRSNSNSDIELSFPLFTSIIQLTTSSYVQSDSYLYATCLNIVVGLLKISDPSIRTWIATGSDMEQQQLCTHLTQQSTELYCRIVNLTTGPIVDAERSKSTGFQLDAFNDQLDMYNDIFSCSIRTLNVRLCEMLLQTFIHHTIQYLIPGPNQKFFQVGISDRDVIPLREARLQVSILLLSRLFFTLEYEPFVRMLAVTLFHPKSTLLWQSKDVKGRIIMLTLNKIVRDDKAVETMPNEFRSEILKVMSGEYGEWLAVGTSALFENAFIAIDNDTFLKLLLLPSIVTPECNECSTDSLEKGLSSFLDQNHEYKSIVSTIALDCVTLIAVKFIVKVASLIHYSGKELHRFDLYYRSSTLVKSINRTMLYFFDQTLQALHLHNVNDIIISYIESVVEKRYKFLMSSPKQRATSNQQDAYVYSLHPFGPTNYCKGPDSLIRKLPGAKWNDIEVSRFHITMALHFRAIHRIIRRYHLEGSRSEVVSTSTDEFELIDEAGELCSIFSCLQARPSAGTDIDLQGRMKFNFTVHGIQDESQRGESHSERMRSFSEDMMFRETSDLILVLDTTSIIVVRPIASQQTIESHSQALDHGIIVCHIPLSDVIAAACDTVRLHIAVRYENVGCLIRNGNMIVTLDSPGTCLIVHQYLEKCRKLLREDLHQKIINLFSSSDPVVQNKNKTSQQKIVNDLEIPQAKTF